MEPLMLAGTALDVAGGIYGLFHGINQARQGRQLLRQLGNRPEYQANPLAMQQVGLRQAQLNATPAAYQDQTNNILANQAGTIYNARQAAGTGSQLLNMIGATQGNTNQALRQQAIDQNAQYQNRLAGLEAAQQTAINEGTKAFESKAQNYQNQFDYAVGLQNAGAQSTLGGLKSLSGTAGSLYSAEHDNSTLSQLLGLAGSARQAPVLQGTNPSQMQQLLNVLSQIKVI